MTALTLQKFQGELLVVGPIHGELSKLTKIEELSKDYEHVIINSGCIPSLTEDVRPFIKQISKTLENPKITYLIGRDDLNAWYALDSHTDEAKWISNKHNVAIVNFENEYRVIITDGGLTHKADNLNDLRFNLELSFVNNFHPYYNGKLGFVIANRPLSETKPKPHRFSIQMGVFPGKPTYGLVMNQYGLNRTILI